MKTFNLSNLDKRWDEIKDYIDNQIISNPKKINSILYSFLLSIKKSGKHVSPESEREKLQWIANDIGDYIFRMTKEFPDVVILPNKYATNNERELLNSHNESLEANKVGQRDPNFKLLLDNAPLASIIKYVCPYGDYTWYRQSIGTPIPDCPTHGIPLIPHYEP